MADQHSDIEAPTAKPHSLEQELLDEARENGAPQGEEHRMSRRVGLNFRATRARYERHLKLLA